MIKSLTCIGTSKKDINSLELRTEKKQKLYGVVYVLFKGEKEKLSPEESFLP